MDGPDAGGRDAGRSCPYSGGRKRVGLSAGMVARWRTALRVRCYGVVESVPQRREWPAGAAPGRRGIWAAAVGFRFAYLRVRRRWPHRVRGQPPGGLVSECTGSRGRCADSSGGAGRRNGARRPGRIGDYRRGDCRGRRAPAVAAAGQLEQRLLGYAADGVNRKRLGRLYLPGAEHPVSF